MNKKPEIKTAMPTHLAAQIFREALDITDGELGAFLDHACGTNAALRAQVEVLLLRSKRAITLCAPSPMTLANPFPAKRPLQDLAGVQMGAFRLLRAVGAGGMGAVWLAARVEGFQQQVAIKWLHAGLSASARSRFARERDTLAKLTHPGIARIVDGGQHGDADWYAMEYVEGDTLDRFVALNQPSLRQRITLLIELCDAVQYAHQNLIVHRDLKPSNVMIDARGRPKLLDFGVAKWLDCDEAGHSASPLTYAYAAPEQIKNEPITTATDIYALGVILFELLTGARPHQIKPGQASGDEQAGVSGNSALSLLQAITDRDVTAPSRALAHNPKQILKINARALKGDLDTIVLKALQRDPARRYASAQAFAADLQRYLGQEPIQASPDSWRYRTGKFVRRNRLAVAGLALGVLSLIAGGLLSWQQATRATAQAARANAAAQLSERALEKARAQAQQTDAVVTHFAALLTRAEINGASTDGSVSTQQLLDWAADPNLSGANRDRATYRALQLGISEFMLARKDYARALIVLETLMPTLAQGSVEERQRILNNLSTALVKLGKLPQAELAIQQALALSLPASATLAQLHINQAALMHAQGQSQQSAEAARAGARIAAQLTDAGPLTRSAIFASAATLLFQQDALDDALAASHQAIALWQGADQVDRSTRDSVRTIEANSLLLRGHIVQAVKAFSALAQATSDTEAAPVRAARASGYAKALALIDQADAAAQTILQAQSSMCQANGAQSLDCLQMTLSAADTLQINGDLERAEALLLQAQNTLASNPIPPLLAVVQRLQARAALLKAPTAASATALIAQFDASKLTSAARRSAIRTLLVSAEQLRARVPDAAQRLANAALSLAAQLPPEQGGVDQCLLAIWRARGAGQIAPPEALQALATAIGAEHPWVLQR